MTMKPLRPITRDDLRGQPGLSRAASDALLAQQPRTVMQALVMHGVGRKTTRRLLALGLLTDPEGVQMRSVTLEELRANRHKADTSATKPSGGWNRSGPPDQQIRCANCGQSTPGYEIVSYGSMESGYRQVCNRCLNAEMAKTMELEGFEHVKFEPMGLTDCTGELHEFHFRTNLFGAGVAIDAFELRDGDPTGYQFQIIGDPEDDLLVLFGQLMQKTRRGLATKHLMDGQHGLQIADDMIVRGKIECDLDHDGRVPMLIIDGREITWDKLGRMLMSFEGWQFKLIVADKSEEL
jgi:hypothetical protein